MGKRRKIAPLVLCALAFLAALTYAAMIVPGPAAESETLVIPHGSSVRDIAALLDEHKIILSPLLFRVAAKTISHASLKAGEYEFTPHQSIRAILTMMGEGRMVVHWFKVPEGLTSLDIMGMMKTTPQLSGDAPVPPEGSLLPETYRFSFGDSRAGMVARMQKAMQDEIVDLWPKRDMETPLKSPEEAVVLASIVEKETGKPMERARIAGVFYNRLRHNMRLQSDPTVIYAIAQAKGPLRRELEHDDLAFPSPFNTYTNDGLPPGPICNPGRAALEAVLHPEQNDFLYFVADGTGGHVFAHDLAEHNQNVTKWNTVKATKAP